MKYYIHTFGCKVNQYESQLISEKFKNDNFECVKKPEEADIIIFNSCTVTAKADKECKYFLRKMSKLPNKPKIMLTGCLVKNKNVCIKELLPNIEIIEDKTKLFNKPQNQMISGFDKHSRAFLKIQDGCKSFCSYCIVPYVRDVLWSKPENEVIPEITNLAKNGYCEIVLTGIHIGKYHEGLSNLLEKIIQTSLNFRVRISSIELNEIDDKLIELIKQNPDKICCHLHIPLQSGSDEILRQMNRKYSSKDFEKKINKIMQILPDLTLTTDIITGFPGETEKYHKETCKFVKRIPFAKVHIFRYSDRAGTKASMFTNKVFANEIKNRSKDLFEIDYIKRKDFLNKNIGKKRKAVKIAIGKNIVLTDNYITVPIEREKLNQINGIFEVEITDKSEI
ncbi:tRNA (N(6)-L-threonylcarbamoyladenosine(37)-C(2))-methylthiotransferase MtaB [Endomicrobiia bacterium]|nr:tRNA (N(6)-L-threonylcarbamoyladenosine(37)-C(2))-methylthiotransferase MtaB [Endomicrobiia bacterium]GHT69583.1 tRNA (N(6)-L-threonylcarbamoyladenosine(37)-C(2))-methylthiotransferase MtaB [Endomicrobiia bacterium]GHT75315.1 tRNA (N(6)-L-threonylcarbamoyladenosine(37)-C(2))-methylthiotransferase MtaB [Endomicrobiia bacterium]